MGGREHRILGKKGAMVADVKGLRQIWREGEGRRERGEKFSGARKVQKASDLEQKEEGDSWERLETGNMFIMLFPGIHPWLGLDRTSLP